MAGPVPTLQLDRTLQNNAFESWRLGGSFVHKRTSAPLPAPVASAAIGSATDFLHTRERVLHNHLLHSQGRLFVCCSPGGRSSSAADGSGMAVMEVLATGSDGSAPAAGPELRHFADVDGADAIEAVGGSAAAPLNCSVAVVAAPEVDSAAAPDELLVSSGNGDLRLLRRQADGTVQQSAVVHPMRPQPPLTGVTPFVLELAWRQADGSIGCVLWTLQDKTSSTAAHCTLWHVVLRDMRGQVDDGLAALTVSEVCLLQRSTTPPHCVAGASSATSSRSRVLVAAELNSELDEAAGSGPHAQGHTADGRQDASGNSGNGTAATATNDDDDDDVDPRTLAEAAARLAHRTSEEPVGALPQQQWADLYKETGPDGLGALGSEPGCTLTLFDTSSPAPAEASASTSESSGSRVPVTWSLACGPHKLLSAQRGSRDGCVLLGVSDDVDCAVVRAEVPSPAGEEASAQVKHEAYVPALAYVAAGKTQRRHLLLGEPGAGVAAVLVEYQKYAYVYGASGRQAQHGVQEVVDMQLAQDEAILGARLITQQQGGAMLLLLTQRQIISYDLQAQQ